MEEDEEVWGGISGGGWIDGLLSLLYWGGDLDWCVFAWR